MYLDIYGKLGTNKNAVIEIGDYCLNRCLHCSSCGSPEGKISIALEDFCSIIDILASLNYGRIILSGGEPFLNDNIDKYLYYIKKKGMEVYVYTSGVLYNYNILSYLPLIDRIIVSIYSIDSKIHNSITGKQDSLEKTLFFIRYLMKNKVKYEINTVLLRNNSREIIDIINSDIGKNSKRINVLKLVIQGNAEINQKAIEPSRDEIDNALSEIISLDNVKASHSFNYDNGICDAITGKICITSDGHVLPCEAFKGVRYKYPIYSEIDLYEYLTGIIDHSHHDCTYAMCQCINME